MSEPLLDDLHGAMENATSLAIRLRDLADAFHVTGNDKMCSKCLFHAQEVDIIKDQVLRGTNAMIKALVDGAEHASINLVRAAIAGASKHEDGSETV